MLSYAKAEAFCEAKTRHPLVKPGPIDARRAQKANWSDPAMRSKLADAHAMARGDDEKAARILGVSLGSNTMAAPAVLSHNTAHLAQDLTRSRLSQLHLRKRTNSPRCF